MLGVGLAAAMLWSACGDPCDDLAKKICKCEIGQSAELACQRRVDSDKRSPSEADQERCAELLDTCTCRSLACGDFARCGLAKDPGIDLGVETCR